MGVTVFRQRLRRRAAPLAVAIGAAAMVSSVASGALAESPPPSGELSDFELGGTAGVVSFKFSYPNLVLPYVITGGVLESFSLAAGTGRAQGVAGFMPVPIATSGSLLIPTNDPITGTPIPEEIRAAAKSIDFSAFPNQCQSDYPAVADGGDEKFCGGPASEDARLGFTAAMANGHTRSSGTSEDPLTAAAVSTSRGVDVKVPALQMTIHGGWSKATTGRNSEGIPESRSELEIDGFTFLTGLIRVEGVRSVAVATSDGTEEGVKTHSAFNVREVRVAGVPVIVGRDGVTVNAQTLVPGTSVRQAADAVTEALAENEVQLRLVPAPPPQQDGAQVAVQSGGIEIIHKGTSVTPADSIYRIGFSSARASAARSSALDELGPIDAGSDSPATTPGGAVGDVNTGLGDTGALAPAETGGFSGDTGSDAFAAGDAPSSFSAGFGGGSGDVGGAAPSGPSDLNAGTSGTEANAAPSPGPTAAVTVAAVSPLPPSSVKYVFAVFVGLALLGACVVPLRR